MVQQEGEKFAAGQLQVTGPTDAGGMVELKGETVWYQTSVSAQAEGFYKSLKYGHWTVKRNGNRWEPWPVEVNLVMKKIKNPKPMYVVKFDGQKWLNFPNKQLGPFGFDLMVGDWIHPHGKGKISDFILTGQRDNEDDTGITPKGKFPLHSVMPGTESQRWTIMEIRYWWGLPQLP